MVKTSEKEFVLKEIEFCERKIELLEEDKKKMEERIEMLSHILKAVEE